MTDRMSNADRKLQRLDLGIIGAQRDWMVCPGLSEKC